MFHISKMILMRHVRAWTATTSMWISAFPFKGSILKGSIQNKFNKYMWANSNDQQFIDGWLAMYDMVESRWWRKAWAYQEVISSTQPYLLCSRQYVPRITLSSILSSYCGINRWFIWGHKTHLDWREYYPDHHRLTPIRNREELAKTVLDDVGYFFGLKDCRPGPADLKYSQNCYSSDMRDKAFDVLGLPHPGY
jgi:hypothetical protein